MLNKRNNYDLNKMSIEEKKKKENNQKKKNHRCLWCWLNVFDVLSIVGL